jgi:hypothetical protein
MVFRIFAIIALVVLAILVIAAFRTGTLQIVRSRSIQAPPDKVFAMIDDFHNCHQDHGALLCEVGQGTAGPARRTCNGREKKWLSVSVFDFSLEE